MDNFNEYGEFCERTWFSGPSKKTGEKMNETELAIMTLGIGGEAGEVMEKVKKHFRDEPLNREQLLKELGDVVYYAVTIARYFGFKPSDILNANIAKLEDRIARGTTRGSGDSR